MILIDKSFANGNDASLPLEGAVPRHLRLNPELAMVTQHNRWTVQA